MTWNFQLGIS